MSNSEKKKLSNEKRLKAVQQWQKHRQQKVDGKASHISFVQAPATNEGKGKLKLFDDSDGEILKVQPQFVGQREAQIQAPATRKEKGKLKLFDDSDGEDETDKEIFKVRPQFEGQRGAQLLEMSSHFSERFKLDERFKDDNDESPQVIENEEKKKNIKILESILGYEVTEKYPEGRSSAGKRHVSRFDPEDESSSKYIKTQEITEDKPTKKKRSKKEPDVEEPIPISNERYIEVSSNLKDILSSTSEPFSLSKKFGFNSNKEDVVQEDSSQLHSSGSLPSQNEKNKNGDERVGSFYHKSRPNFEHRDNFGSHMSFFISDDDKILKEGVQFFQRTKSLDEIRNEWHKNKDSVLDIFKKKRKSNLRRFSHCRLNASQRNRMKKK